MFEQIVRAMGKTVDDREVQELLKLLGSAPGKPAKPNSDGYVVAKKRGVELLFSSDVKNERFPVRKVNRKQVKYLSWCWLRERFAGPWPAPFDPALGFADLRGHYGEEYDLWGFEWDEVREVRWRVPLEENPDARLHVTFHVEDKCASAQVALAEHAEYFEYLDAEQADVFAGFFVAWCIDNGLLHPDLAARARDAVKAVKARKMTGREFVVGQIDHRAWDGKHNHVWSCDLSPDEREFFYCYIHRVLTEGIWGKYETGYYEDFLGLFRKRFPKLKQHPPPWSVVPDTWEHHEAMAKVIAGRYATWQKKSKERRKQFQSRMARG